jgi:hypothetical protein
MTAISKQRINGKLLKPVDPRTTRATSAEVQAENEARLEALHARRERLKAHCRTEDATGVMGVSAALAAIDRDLRAIAAECGDMLPPQVLANIREMTSRGNTAIEVMHDILRRELAEVSEAHNRMSVHLGKGTAPVVKPAA